MQNIIYCDHVEIKNEEVVIKNKDTIFYISLSDCAKNFSVERSTKLVKCVADRDVSSLSYIFYTKPKTKVMVQVHQDILRPMEHPGRKTEFLLTLLQAISRKIF